MARTKSNGSKDSIAHLSFEAIAKDDTHADDIVRICREVFGKGNDFCQKITYRTGFFRIVKKKPQPDGSEIEEITRKRASSLFPDEIFSAFRNSYNPRIAVAVDKVTSQGFDAEAKEKTESPVSEYIETRRAKWRSCAETVRRSSDALRLRLHRDALS